MSMNQNFEQLARQIIWKTREGKRMPIRDMENGHLHNALRLLRREGGDGRTIEVMEYEADRRTKLKENRLKAYKDKEIQPNELIMEPASDGFEIIEALAAPPSQSSQSRPPIRVITVSLSSDGYEDYRKKKKRKKKRSKPQSPPQPQPTPPPGERILYFDE